jgi:hypothetical protein
MQECENMTLKYRILKRYKKEWSKTPVGTCPTDFLINIVISETLKEVDSLKLSDDFHEWHKGILGEDDILNKIIDKIIEKVKEVRK